MADLRTAAAVGKPARARASRRGCAVKGIALDYLRPDAFAAEDMREALMTVVVPAPEESGHAIIGWLMDHAELPGTDRPAWAALKPSLRPEQRSVR